MTAAEFAANLRAELGRQDRSPYSVAADILGYEFGTSWTPAVFDEVKALSDRIESFVYRGPKPEMPTPAEITALATALGCPEERLTVSREELERRLEEASRDSFEEAKAAEKYRLWYDASFAECETLRARLEEVQAECDHHATRASKLDCERTDLEYDCQALRARVAELEAAQ